MAQRKDYMVNLKPHWRKAMQEVTTHKTFLDVLAVVIATAALFVSVRGCQLAETAQSMTVRLYREERLLILTADVAKEERHIQLRTTDNALTFLGGTIYFPPSVYPDPVPVRPSGEVLHLGAIEYKLQQFIAKKVPSKAGVAAVSTGGQLPVFVQSCYAAKGESHTDQSLYMLGLTFWSQTQNPCRRSLSRA